MSKAYRNRTTIRKKFTTKKSAPVYRTDYNNKVGKRVLLAFFILVIIIIIIFL